MKTKPKSNQDYYTLSLTCFKLKHLDYYKTLQAVITKTLKGHIIELTYINDEGFTAEPMHRKIRAEHYKIVNKELLIFNSDEDLP